MAANKVAGIRAALCYDDELARLAREHNDAQVISIGARMTTVEQARSMVEVFLGTAVQRRPAARAAHRHGSRLRGRRRPAAAARPDPAVDARAAARRAARAGLTCAHLAGDAVTTSVRARRSERPEVVSMPNEELQRPESPAARHAGLPARARPLVRPEPLAANEDRRLHRAVRARGRPRRHGAADLRGRSRCRSPCSSPSSSVAGVILSGAAPARRLRRRPRALARVPSACRTSGLPARAALVVLLVPGGHGAHVLRRPVALARRHPRVRRRPDVRRAARPHRVRRRGAGAARRLAGRRRASCPRTATGSPATSSSRT